MSTEANVWGFLRRVRIDLRQHTALVETAAELTDEIRDDIRARLTAAYGAGLATTFAVNPAIDTTGISVEGSSDGYLEGFAQV